jgi:hypothetical protein
MQALTKVIAEMDKKVAAGLGLEFWVHSRDIEAKVLVFVDRDAANALGLVWYERPSTSSVVAASPRHIVPPPAATWSVVAASPRHIVPPPAAAINASAVPASTQAAAINTSAVPASTQAAAINASAVDNEAGEGGCYCASVEVPSNMRDKLRKFDGKTIELRVYDNVLKVALDIRSYDYDERDYDFEVRLWGTNTVHEDDMPELFKSFRRWLRDGAKVHVFWHAGMAEEKPARQGVYLQWLY